MPAWAPVADPGSAWPRASLPSAQLSTYSASRELGMVLKVAAVCAGEATGGVPSRMARLVLLRSLWLRAGGESPCGRRKCDRCHRVSNNASCPHSMSLLCEGPCVLSPHTRHELTSGRVDTGPRSGWLRSSPIGLLRLPQRWTWTTWIWATWTRTCSRERMAEPDRALGIN